MGNSNLHNAKTAKNDEFYTQLTDIEKELGHYKDHFKDKIVFCNCDDPTESNFWKYFSLNFNYLKLKKLIATHYDATKPTYKLEYDGINTIKTKLKQNGDFRSSESIEILEEADIIVTNPPFSLFREYVAQLVEYDKDFLIIGSKNTITFKEIFPLIKNNKIWLGYNMPPKFKQPDGTMKAIPAIWFTNLTHKKRNEDIILYKEYDKDDYPTYDDYNVINVDKVKEIPKDYDDVMGVPITFLHKYNPDQFEILGIANSARWIDYKCLTLIDKRKIYNRILIKIK